MLIFTADHTFSTYAKYIPKTNISYPMIRTHMCVYQGVKNTTFLRKFCVRIKWMIPSIFSKTKADLTVKSHKLHDTEEAFRKCDTQ